MTPVEERIDHAEAREIAETAHVWLQGVGTRQRMCRLSEAEGAILRDAYLDLLTEHFAREETCKRGCFPETGGSFVCGRPAGHDGLHASFYGRGAVWNEDQVQEGFLLALPATEPAQPEECVHHYVMVVGGMSCVKCGHEMGQPEEEPNG